MTKQLARKGSQVEKAIEIYRMHQGKLNHRQLCLADLQSQLGHKATTAATYYYLAELKLDTVQKVTTKEVIASKRKRKFSAVKLVRGSDKASRVHCFFTKKAAQTYNDQNGFNKVVTGVQQLGKDIGTVAA